MKIVLTRWRVSKPLMLEFIVIRKILLGLSLAFLGTTLAVAQCSCGDCGNTARESFPVGSNYTSMDNVYSSMPVGGCNSCGVQSCGGDCYGTAGERCCDALTRCRYMSIFGGGSWMESFKQSNLTDNSVDANRGGFEDGYAFGVAIGAQVHPNVRYELETTFRDNNAEDWFIEDFTDGVVTASAQAPAFGELESTAGMVNFLFDFPKRQPGCANFYAGVGVGILYVDGEINSAGTTYDINDTSAAFQAIGGVSRAISQRVDLFAEYRYLNAQNILVQNQTAGVSLGDFEFTNNSLLFGLRIRR
jgi:opacity protein-like surface antigen